MHRADTIYKQFTEEELQDKNLSDSKHEKENIKADIITIWLDTLEILKKRLKKPSFETWIKPSFLVDIKEEFAMISVKNDFTRNFLLQSFAKDIQIALKETSGKALALNFLIEDRINPYENLIKDNQGYEEQQSKQIKISDIEKNKKIFHYSFSNFVATENNRSAITFSKAIIENASGIYKSLIVISKSGLGKTHLLKACAEETRIKNETSKVKYVNAEKFTNELIIAIQRNETYKFRQNYRNLNLFLLDDLDFLDNKKSCQDELVFTIESILNSGGSFIISSSKKIDEFKSLNPKLKSFMQASLVALIEKPKFKDREMLIEKKAHDLNLKLKPEQVSILSEKSVEGIREIEGFLLQLSAQVNLNHLEITDELISESFGGLFNEFSNIGLSLDKISIKVSEYFGISEKDLKGNKRSKEFSQARHLAIYLSYNLLELSYSRIGAHYSGRKHSSIIHSIKTIENILNSNLPSAKATQKIIDEIKTNLSA